MKILERIIENHPDESIVRFDGYDDAVIGIDTDTMRLIYSVKKTIEIIYNQTDVKKSDLSKEEIEEGVTIDDKRMEMAIEHFEYNVRGSKGEGFPIWCEDNY